MSDLTNPYTPGAGYTPPHLAGREQEIEKFKKILEQDKILKNPIFTGLRGVGKTVLLTEIGPIAKEYNWVWVGKELAESVFVSEETIVMRLLADLSFFTSTQGHKIKKKQMGLGNETKEVIEKFNLAFLTNFFQEQPGLLSDKIQATFEYVWPLLEQSGKKGIIFAYDEAQIVTDQREKDQYPLSMMLGLFQSLQKKGMRYMLLLSGLPSLYPKLVEARTYAERMFAVHSLGNLSKWDSKDAIEIPLVNKKLQFTLDSVNKIISLSGGYPYFIQFMCRECFDHFKLQMELNPGREPSVPIGLIMANLDSSFFAGRWAGIPERQKEFLFIISIINKLEEQFTFSQIQVSSDTNSAKCGIKPFNRGDIAQTLARLTERTILYKVSHGKYSFAIPMFSDFIQRQFQK